MQTSQPYNPDMEAANAHDTRSLWPAWAAVLRRWGVDGAAAVLVESAGPLNVLLAQILYLGQPLVPGASAAAVARLLDDPQQAAQFAAYLREEERP